MESIVEYSGDFNPMEIFHGGIYRKQKACGEDTESVWKSGESVRMHYVPL